MSVKWKIVFYIGITLVIGIIIGVLLNRAIVQKRIKDMLAMRGAGLLHPRAERILKPTNPEQGVRIQAALDEHARRLSEIHERFRREIDSAFKSFKSEMDPILTPEQKKLFEKMIPGPPPVPGRPPVGFPPMKNTLSAEFELAALKTGLNLSEDQAAKIKAILDEFEIQMKSLFEKGIPPEDFDSRRKIEEKKDQEIEKILTDDQKEKYEQIKNRRFERPRWPISPP
jgi:hypothetical protein